MVTVAAIATFLGAALLVALIVALRDARKAREVARRMRDERDAAIQIGLEKSKFLAMASHDLRQPLHAVTLFMASLKRKAVPDDVRNVVEKLSAGVDGFQYLFDTLASVVRIDAGLVVPRPRSIQIASIMDGLAIECLQQAKAKGLHFQYVTSSAVVATDPALAEQLLRNVLTSVIRDTSGKVLLGCRRKGNVLRVEVHDTGRGIPAEQIAGLLNRSGPQETGQSHGDDLGLGLTIIRKLADILNVGIGARSESSRGSCLILEFGGVASAPGLRERRDIQANVV